MELMDREIKAMDRYKSVVPKDVVYNKGYIIVRNVPHNKYVEKVNSGEHAEYTLSGNISIRLSAITTFMEQEKLSEFDYRNYDLYPEIGEILDNYR